MTRFRRFLEWGRGREVPSEDWVANARGLEVRGEAAFQAGDLSGSAMYWSRAGDVWLKGGSHRDRVEEAYLRSMGLYLEAGFPMHACAIGNKARRCGVASVRVVCLLARGYARDGWFEEATLLYGDVVRERPALLNEEDQRWLEGDQPAWEGGVQREGVVEQGGKESVEEEGGEELLLDVVSDTLELGFQDLGAPDVGIQGLGTWELGIEGLEIGEVEIEGLEIEGLEIGSLEIGGLGIQKGGLGWGIGDLVEERLMMPEPFDARAFWAKFGMEPPD